MKTEKSNWFENEIKKLDNNLDSFTFKYILDFSEDILKILDDKGIKNKNKYLAKKLGCSPAYISKLFNGKSNFTVRKLVELANAVNYDLNISLRPKLAVVKASPVFTTSINVKGELENFAAMKPNVPVRMTIPQHIGKYLLEPEKAA